MFPKSYCQILILCDLCFHSGSPYAIDINIPHYSGIVYIHGPGIGKNGVLGEYESHFWVDARDAGSGELNVSVMGPKGMYQARKHLYGNPVSTLVLSVVDRGCSIHGQIKPITIKLIFAVFAKNATIMSKSIDLLD